MTDNKRQSVGGKAQGLGPASTATGPGMATAMVPLEAALSGAIGARVRITTAPPVSSTLEGTLFTACPITNLVAINTSNQSAPAGSANQTQPSDYHIIPISRIQSFQLLSLAPSSNSTDGPFTNASPALHALDIRALKAREASAVAKLQENEARRGKGVTREAQDLFDAFSRTMPARWDGTSIVVADAVVIAKPYRVDDCRPLVAGDSAALTRVRKVLEMERKKIELRNASAAMGNTNHFARHAGAAQGGAGAKDRVAVPNHLDTSSAPAPRKGG
ncbi:hypothetical protein VTN96DRAFT_569 [Rasamsonia emersonii]|uniref:AD domain-containing protein n=1 Tax=Rasamsonia emersonii (strain ATCC 16479 / CBS 393.64 / IMI 116815) TaxID=1408163 RepID=A0A0F4YXR6_RASE3|nr:hypothetical protein T310_2828 [Rasamsonia emersonii CBS 393.64]KKA23102.1 hypothetical protein T310_2828 [Rasamsonia emersonii CBS 393.64]